MDQLLWLIPTIPFISFLILALFGIRMPKKAIAGVGVSAIGLSALLTILTGIALLSSGEAAFSQTLWRWMQVGQFSPDFGFHLDRLTLVFIFVITFVGFLIHLFSSEFMYEEEGFGRFFAAMNLFVSAMLILVMGNNLVMLYLGWEGVGLCSYLLIGFYYKETPNGMAAQKAFIVTRIGDTAMGIGLFLLFASLGTLNFTGLAEAADAQWATGEFLPVIASLLIVGGAVGKSAQLPLQTWLPDAMAGPSPVSALIHAATMVTAGVYIIARMNFIFVLAPSVMTVVAIIGALTLLIAGFTALTQSDIKRVLAYSTISQIGYMFLALGVGAWSAAIFHFMIHAFFKALLFLGAGVVIHALHDEHDMFKMGGLRHQLPVTFWTFLIGSACLAAVPLITAGFYSKDMILWYAFAGDQGSAWLWIAGFVGAIITAFYTFRMVFVTFFGEAKMEVHHKPGNLVKIPLVTLGVLSLLAGFIETPHTLGHMRIFSDLLHGVLPAIHAHGAMSTEIIIQLVTALAALGSIYAAYQIFNKRRLQSEKLVESGTGSSLFNFWNRGWAFDTLYNVLFVRPMNFISRINRNDIIDKIYSFLALLAKVFHYAFSLTQTGRLRWYIMGLTIGAVLTLTIIVFL